MRHIFFRDMYEVELVTGFIRDLYAGSVVFHDGGERNPAISSAYVAWLNPGLALPSAW